MESSNQQQEKAAEAARERGWVERARRGDMDAFGELVKMYNDRVYGVVYRVTGRVDDARELTQVAWVKAWQRLASYGGESRFFTWIYRIAVNAALDHLRLRVRRGENEYREEQAAHSVREDAAPSVSARPDHAAESAEIQQAFRRALDTLSPEHRAALVLREVDGLSYDEIAKITRCRTGTVMSRIFYARKVMRACLKEWKS
jgi:RNA polymerase sigma-70 factor (ECF subfamily)